MTENEDFDHDTGTKYRNDQPDAESSKSSRELSSTSQHSPVRTFMGSGLVSLSNWINDNMIVARYAAIMSIGLLAVYGLSHSPLFFRYRTVADIPSKHFQNRKTLVGRLVETAQTTPEGPILCQIRHLSTFERLLFPKSCFDWWMKLHPSYAALGQRPDQNLKELLLVELAGVRSPPHYSSASEAPSAWLHSFADNKPLVKVQLLARRVTKNTPEDDNYHEIRKKRKIPGLSDITNDDSSVSHTTTQVAVAKVFYRPKTLQLLATDLAHSLILTGRATVSNDDGLFPHYGSRDRIVDATCSVQMLKNDAAYLTKLGRAEYEAARGAYGMWADHEIRKSRSDVVEEVEFQTTAPIWKKVWRWLNGG